jgi:ligand-binding sensor domain-containing protein
MRVFAFLLLLPLCADQARALDLSKSMTQYAHRIWGQEEGLFQPTIYSILQTREGFLWLGTQDSLIRFDGIHFREFAEGSSVLHGSLVHALAEDAAGNLWAASLGSGLVRIAPDGSTKQYLKKDGLPGDSVFCVVPGPDGSIWACTTEGLARIRAGRVTAFTTRDGLSSNRMRTACEGSDGALWVAGLDAGLSRWNGVRFAPYALPARIAQQSITALACDSQGGVWVGTEDGLAHLSSSDQSFYSQTEGLPDNNVLALLETSDGTLWVGTDDGISRLRGGQINTYRTRDGLSHSQVLSLWMDQEQTLWAGTKNGLDQFTNGNVTPYTTNEGLSTNDTGPVLEDSVGRLWVGTLGRGLNEFDGHHFRSVTTRDGLLSDTVLSLATGRHGELWVGTERGVNRIVNGKVTATFERSSGLVIEVRSLEVDEEGTLWAGSSQGVLQYLRGNRFFSAEESAPVPSVFDSPGQPLFMGAESPGFFILRGTRAAFQPLAMNHSADCFFYDSAARTLWMGTLGAGLLRWK